MEVDSEQYFSSYEDLDIHKLMLEDEPRTLAYKNAILNNKQYFKDKVVMDVGCGTGILSIFCAQAGAKKVFAVEASNLANLAKEIVKENNFENVIEVIHSRVEDVELPNYMKVDAIVSEWMGFYLLHEGMLDSVLYARDRFLKDGGEIFPESATIYIAPCSVPSMYNQWDNVHGVSMKSFSKELRVSKGSKPEILTIKPEDLLGTEVALCWINLREDESHDLNSYSIEHVVGASKNGFYQGLCLWFECNFPELPNGTGDSRTVLDTSPQSPATHWKQTVIVLPDQLEVEEGEPIAFQLEMTRADATSRRYNLLMTMLDPETIEHPLPCSCHMTTCILAKTFMKQQAEHAIAQKKEEDTSVLVDEEINDDDEDDN
ncbi:protein arginine N-methyltransferase 6 [Spodoptera litura]|uniref:type I protein arginine methyltransferase n=1 Tax=Spodoptera litura TaxID=69820 RepID=A0A9J7E8S9_SPOLT|nr:protein arginine N-methyltransferase 6 [Spodoptera litura]